MNAFDTILEKLIFNHWTVCTIKIKKKRLAQPSSVGLEFKYKSQEVFSYLALVFEDSFQTTLLMSLSQSYSNTYVNLLVNGLILFQIFC